MLKNKIAIYVPSTINVNQKTDSAAQVNNTCVFLSGLFGGCTSFNAAGCWTGKTGELVKENITIIYAYCTSLQLLKSKKTIINYCRELCMEMSQEAISLEINNKLYFID